MAYKLLKLFQPNIDANLVHDAHVVRRIFATGVRIERRLDGPILSRFICIFVGYPLAKLAVIAQCQSFFDGRIPQVTKRRLIHVAAVVTIAARGIQCRNCFLAVIGDVSGGAPNVTLRADLGVAKGAVE